MHLRQSGVVVRSPGMEVPGKDHSTPERVRVPVFDDLLEHTGLTRPSVAIAVGSALYLLYLLSVYIEGFQEAWGRLDFWKNEIEPPVVLTYVLLVHYFLDIYGRRAVQSVRQVVNLDDRTFNELVAGMSATIVRYQWVPMILFSGLGVLLTGKLDDWSSGFRWTTLVSGVISLAEYAVIGSIIYLVVARNRFFTSLFRQPVNIDIFNSAPVRPMARWGLSVSAAVVGGVTISVLLVGNPQELLSLEHLPMYLVAMVTAILAFFGSMLSTHRVLVNAKNRELSAIRGKLSAMYGELMRASETDKLQGMQEMASTITAWLGYERRIAAAQEWPYTANTLSGLFATVLLPIIITMVQQLIL